MVHFSQCPSVRAFAEQMFHYQLAEIMPDSEAGLLGFVLPHSAEDERKFAVFRLGGWCLAKHGQLHASVPVPPKFSGTGLDIAASGIPGLLRSSGVRLGEPHLFLGGLVIFFVPLCGSPHPHDRAGLSVLGPAGVQACYP